MQVIIELEESVYNLLQQALTLTGVTITPELFISRILTQVAIPEATNPDALQQMVTKASEVSEYTQAMERILKQKGDC